MPTDCVIPAVTRSDLDRAEVLAASVKKFFRFEHRVFTVAPRSLLGEAAERLALNKADGLVAVEELIPAFAESLGLGPRRQREAITLEAAQRVRSEFYWILPPESFAVRPVKEADFLLGGRGMANLASDGQVRDVASLLGIAPTQTDSLAEGPSLLHRGLATEVGERIRSRYSDSWRALTGLVGPSSRQIPPWSAARLYSAWASQSDRFSRHHQVIDRPLSGNDLWRPTAVPDWNPAASFRDPPFLFTVVDPMAGVSPAWLRSQVSPYLAADKRDWLAVLREFRSRGGRRVVEVGGMRSRGNVEGDGCATIVWAQNAEEVWSVDIDPVTTRLAAEETSCYGTVRTVTADGIGFLESFELPIDLLYLDGWDCGTADGCYLPESAERHLEAFRAAEKNLHAQSLVLIDDTFADGRGKGELVIPAMLAEGWRGLSHGYQTLLGRPSPCL